MSSTPSTSSQWHAVTPSTRPLSLSILELTPLALTLSLTLASPFASSSSSSPLPGSSSSLHPPGSVSKRRKRPRKTESDDETAVDVEDEHRESSYAASSSTHIPGSWPAEVGRSFKDLLSHGVVVSVNGQPWSRIVAHASDPDPDESEGDEAEDEWEEDWEPAGGKSDEEGAEEGLGAEGMQRRRPRRARFTMSAQNAVGGPIARRKEGRRGKMESGKDRAVVVVYGLSPGKEYEIELRVVGMGGTEIEASVSNSVLIPPLPGASLHPRSRANSLRSRQHPRSRSNSTTTPAQSSENTTPSRRGTPPPGSSPAVEAIAPTPVLSAVDTQTAQMRQLVASTALEKEHLSAQIKEARRASQRAEAALRQEIDAVKKSTEKAGSMDLRAKQKALALQEQVKQGWAGAEAADKETVGVEAGMGDLEAKLQVAMSEVGVLREELARAREREDEVREKDKRMRAEEEKKLSEVVGKVEKLKVKKERKEAEKIELERRIEDLERQREDVERHAEEEKRRIASGHWGTQGHWDGHYHDGVGHNRLTTHPSLSNIGAQGGYGAGPAYRPRGAQGYQPRFPSAGAARPGSTAPPASAQASPTNFFPPISSVASFRPPPPGPPPVKSSTAVSPAIGSRTISSTSSGVNAAAAPFVPSLYTGSSSSSSANFDALHHTTLMPPGMQHRIYLPSQSAQNQFQSVRPRPTPTFHPPPSVLAEQAAHAQAVARNSPTTTSSPAFPPLPGASSPGQTVKAPSSGSAPQAPGPSLASIITRAVLSPTSSLAAQNMAGGTSAMTIPTQAGRRPSPPASVVLGSGGGTASNTLKSLNAPSFSPTHSPISPNPPLINRSSSPTPPSSRSNSIPIAPTQQSQPYSLGGRVTFAPPPPAAQDYDFPPLSPSGPWASLNPSIGSRVRGESGDAGPVGPQGNAAGINRTQTPPAVAWGAGGERVGSPLGMGGAGSAVGSGQGK